MFGALDFSSHDPALYLEGPSNPVSYHRLGLNVAKIRALLQRLPRPALVFLFGPNCASSVAAYLACLGERIPLGLGEPNKRSWIKICRVYNPTAVLLPVTAEGPVGYVAGTELPGKELCLWVRFEGSSYFVQPNENLALLLATSGTTGDGKYVRLTAANLESNARAIGEFLRIKPGDNAIQSLPIYYSYGLSILNSHLISRAAITLTRESFMHPGFWKVIRECGCSSFAGVPYMYEVLRRLDPRMMRTTGIRTITQAGGPLSADHIIHYHKEAAAMKARMFVMYGQTEATARIAYVPSEMLPEKVGCVGIAIPGGKLWLETVAGTKGCEQLHYQGPNVMLGYALEPKHLKAGDELHEHLATGDMGEMDSDGYFRVTGRLSRISKLFGTRICLDSVESELETRFGMVAAVVDGDDRMFIYIERASIETISNSHKYVAGWLRIPSYSVWVKAIDQMPLTSSLKKDYKLLRAQH